MSRRELTDYLRQHGCAPLRQGRRHELWHRPETGHTAGVPRHRTIKRGLIRGICDQLGVPSPFAGS